MLYQVDLLGFGGLDQRFDGGIGVGIGNLIIDVLDPGRFIARLEKALPPDASFLMPTPGTWLQITQ